MSDLTGRDETQVLFLGTAAATPEAGRDTASFLVNGRLLIDTGWCAARRLREFGIDPLDVTTVLLTHCHHDHYLGLPSLLFERAMRARGRGPLPIYGPAEDVERVVALCAALLQTDRFPELAEGAAVEVISVSPGDRFVAGEFDVTAFATRHPVASVGYRLTDRRTGSVVAVTGDTAYTPELAEAVRGADLLVTEASHGALHAPSPDPYLHMGAPEAARLAAEAGAARLALVHCRDVKRHAALAVARRTFADAWFPEDGETVSVSPLPRPLP